MADNRTKTTLTFIGGLNKDKIGANSQVIEHTNSKGQTNRIMIDLGALFLPFGSEFSAIYPDVNEYFEYIDPKTQNKHQALKPVDALFITHMHQDHIGALIDIYKMGYKLPPIYTSEYTGHCIRLSFAKQGIMPPSITRLEDYKEVRIGDIEVTPFYVAHSAVDAMGFMPRTFDDKKPYARILAHGDFYTAEEMPIGHAFNKDAYIKMLEDKPAPMTIAEYDSTSIGTRGKKRLDFKQTVDNVYNVCMANPDRTEIISPVISGSWNNIAIALENAKRLGTKVIFVGDGLKTPRDAMRLCGYDNYDDAIYNGTLSAYMFDKSIKIKYVVNTGALAQGVEEYKNNIGLTPYSPIAMSSAVRIAFDLDPDIQLSHKILGIWMQRDIKDITGNRLDEVLHRFAQGGAKNVITPGDEPKTFCEEVVMQNSGHLYQEEARQSMLDIKDSSFDVYVMGIHGSDKQRQDTLDLAEQVGLKVCDSSNGDHFEISPHGIKQQEIDKKQTLLAVRKVYPGMDGRDDIPLEGVSEYWLIDDQYQPIEKLSEVSNVKVTGPKSRPNGKQIDVEAYSEMPKTEKISPYAHKISERKVKKSGKKSPFLQKTRE